MIIMSQTARLIRRFILIYYHHEHRVQRQNLVLAWPLPLLLRYRSGGAERRPESHIRIRDVWLGNDSRTVRIGKTEWKTALFPKNGCYIVPIKASVREAENLDVDDIVTVRLEVH